MQAVDSIIVSPVFTKSLARALITNCYRLSVVAQQACDSTESLFKCSLMSVEKLQSRLRKSFTQESAYSSERLSNIKRTRNRKPASHRSTKHIAKGECRL